MYNQNSPLVYVNGDVNPEFNETILKIVQDTMTEHTRLLREGIR